MKFAENDKIIWTEHRTYGENSKIYGLGLTPP